MPADPFNKHYALLSPPERLTLLLEAMARQDHADAERLYDACPRQLYRCAEAAFDDRQTTAFEVAALACADLQRLCGTLKAVRWTSVVADSLTAMQRLVAERAFLDGVDCAQGQPSVWFGDYDHAAVAALREAAPVPSCEPTDAELTRRSDAVFAAVDDNGRRVLEIVGAHERQLAGDLALIWAVFGRLCRTRLGVEPET